MKIGDQKILYCHVTGKPFKVELTDITEKGGGLNFKLVEDRSEYITYTYIEKIFWQDLEDIPKEEGKWFDFDGDVKLKIKTASDTDITRAAAKLKRDFDSGKLMGTPMQTKFIIQGIKNPTEDQLRAQAEMLARKAEKDRASGAGESKFQTGGLYIPKAGTKEMARLDKLKGRMDKIIAEHMLKQARMGFSVVDGGTIQCSKDPAEVVRTSINQNTPMVKYMPDPISNEQGPMRTIKCECGSASAGFAMHSDWCPCA